MTPAPVQRQISLPLRKAAEIAYKSIRMRLGRSLLVTSGIVLALAFLMTILTHEVMIDSMRNWIGDQRASRADPAQVRSAEELESLMRSKGVPASPDQIRDSRLQTRWLTGLALLVALVGILNAMLMSVTERFREIGTMKCLGALDGFIVKLFLIESLFQGIAGTVVGVLLGLILSLIAVWSTYGAYAWVNFPARAIASTALICFGIGVVLTVLGAVYPAWQAARMQPVEAMRAET